jgi:hypothetical protein
MPCTTRQSTVALFTLLALGACTDTTGAGAPVDTITVGRGAVSIRTDSVANGRPVFSATRSPSGDVRVLGEVSGNCMTLRELRARVTTATRGVELELTPSGWIGICDLETRFPFTLTVLGVRPDAAELRLRVVVDRGSPAFARDTALVIR